MRVMLKLLCAVLLLTGCAQIIAQRRADQLHEEIKPLVGTATQEDIVLKYGMPTDRMQMDTLEVWRYRWSKGARGVINEAPLPGYPGNDYATVSTREAYDMIEMVFVRGVLARYRIDIRR